MKNLLIKSVPAALLASLLFASCEELNQGEEDAPVFPEAVSEFIEPGASVTINFTANMAWTASIPSDDSNVTSYFAIEDGGFEVYSVSGEAGDASVKIVCKVQEQDFDDHTVELSLTMGEETKVIATVTLASLEKKFSVIVADSNEEGFISGAGEGEDFVPTFTGEALANGATVTMFWDEAVSQYSTYVKIDANFPFTVSGTVTEQNSSLDITSSVDGTAAVYSISSDDVNIGTEDKTYTLKVTSTIDENDVYEYNVVVPAIQPVFNVYPVLVDEYGYVSAEEGAFMLKYAETPIEKGSNITLVWPKGTSTYSYRLLVSSNIAFASTSTPNWLTMAAQTTVGNTVEYFLSVSSSSYAAEDQIGDIVFTISNPEGEDLKFTYKVTLPGMADYLAVDRLPASVKFNETGAYYFDMYGEYMDDGRATGSITSAAGLKFFFVTESNGRYYDVTTDQIQYVNGVYTVENHMCISYSWDDEGTYIQSVPVQIYANDASSEASWMPFIYHVIALPKPIADNVASAAALIETDYSGIKEEYKDYVITVFTQENEGSGSGSDGAGFITSAIDNSYTMIGYVVFEKLESEQDIIDASSNYGLGESIYDAAGDLYSGGEVYLLIYANSSMSEGPGALTISGTYDSCIITPSASWLTAETYDGTMYVGMGSTGATSSGSVGTIRFYNSSKPAAVIYCVRRYE